MMKLNSAPAAKPRGKRQSFCFRRAAGCETRGAGGAAVYTPNASAETKALPVTVADTTGAGDSFIGSFLYQLTRDGVTVETLADIPQEKLADYLTFSVRMFGVYRTA